MLVINVRAAGKQSLKSGEESSTPPSATIILKWCLRVLLYVIIHSYKISDDITVYMRSSCIINTLISELADNTSVLYFSVGLHAELLLESLYCYFYLDLH